MGSSFCWRQAGFPWFFNKWRRWNGALPRVFDLETGVIETFGKARARPWRWEGTIVRLTAKVVTRWQMRHVFTDGRVVEPVTALIRSSDLHTEAEDALVFLEGEAVGHAGEVIADGAWPAVGFDAFLEEIPELLPVLHVVVK